MDAKTTAVLNLHYYTKITNQKMLKNLFIATILLLFSCAESTPKRNKEQQKESIQKFEVSIIDEQTFYRHGDTIRVQITNRTTDSSSVLFVLSGVDTLPIESTTGNISKLILNDNLPVGKQRIIAIADSKESYCNLIITPAKPPKEKNFKIEKSYHHSITDYTQGLFYENGFLYEATGLKGKSVLRKSAFESGVVINEIAIDENYFGEGIASIGNKIVQLTWQENTAFVYDKNTFKKIKEFNYPTEGWGLTTDGAYYILSDGTEYLYFLEPDNFTEVKRIQVYNNFGPVNKLNELEYKNGYIYANVYTKDYLVKIDVATGSVVEKLWARGILSNADYHSNIDVLNGITFVNDKFLITGKNWPKMFLGQFE